MIKKIITCSLAVLLILFSLPLRADDLMQVYHQALNSDPTFQKAYADWMTTRENYPLAISGNGQPGSGLMPNFDVTGNVYVTAQRQTSNNFAISGTYNSNYYLLALTQPIFNYMTWKSIDVAKFQVRAAAASYLASAQDLMFRVTQAYLNVMKAYDQLQYTLASKKSYLHQLITAKQKFQVGLIAITGVYDAQASYDQSVAQEIADRNNLQDQLENLRVLTSRSYRVLNALRSQIPLVIPRPQNIESWVTVADRQNFTIKSYLYNMLAAREHVKEMHAGNYPTLNGSLQYGSLTTGVIPGVGSAVATPGGNLAMFTTTTAQVGLNLNFPIYQGGYTRHSTKQAEYQYLSASDQLEFTHRDVNRQARQAYLGVQSGISKIQADRQTIISSQNKLDSTQAGYEVGTRTMVDVLQAVSQLYQSRQQWADDRYSYLLSIISLKEQAGTLSPADLAEINSWLTSPVNLLAKTSSSKRLHPCKKKGIKKLKKLPKPTRKNAIPPKHGLPVPHYHGARAVKIHVVQTNPMNYAIQVFAARDVAQAHAFIQRHTHKNNLRVVKLAAQSGWYKVVYGQFATAKQAQAAIQQLPADFAQEKPWVVNVSETFKNAVSSQEQESTLPPPSAVQSADRVTSFNTEARP